MLMENREVLMILTTSIAVLIGCVVVLVWRRSNGKESVGSDLFTACSKISEAVQSRWYEWLDPSIKKVHMCNKLVSRHVRVGLADPRDVPRYDICENAPAFFYCGIDGSSLCLQCDMIVHVGGKRTHARYLLLRQRVEFPGDKPGQLEDPASQPMDPGVNKKRQSEPPNMSTEENHQNHRASLVPMLDANSDGDGQAKINTGEMFDLNMNPQQMHEQASNN